MCMPNILTYICTLRNNYIYLHNYVYIVHLKSPGTKLASIYSKRASTSLISLALLYLYYYARFMSSLAPARPRTRFHISARTHFYFSPRTRFHISTHIRFHISTRFHTY